MYWHFWSKTVINKFKCGINNWFKSPRKCDRSGRNEISHRIIINLLNIDKIEFGQKLFGRSRIRSCRRYWNNLLGICVRLQTSLSPYFQQRRSKNFLWWFSTFIFIKFSIVFESVFPVFSSNKELFTTKLSKYWPEFGRNGKGKEKKYWKKKEEDF